MEKMNEKLGVSFKSDSSDVQKYIYGNTVDELIDGLALIKDGKFINQFVDEFKGLTPEQLLKLDEIMLTTYDAKEIIKYAKRRKETINTQKYQDKLVELKDIERLIKFTSFAIRPDIVKTEKAVIDYGKPNDGIYLLEEIEGVCKEKIKSFILSCEDAYSAYQLIRILIDKQEQILDIDILEAKRIVKQSKRMSVICAWARDIGNVTEMEDVTIEYGTARDMYDFAKLVKGADIEKIRTAIEQKDDIIIKYNFKKDFPKPIVKKSFWSKLK